MWGTILLVTLFYVTYLWMKKKYRYWAEKGVKFDKPLPIFGNMLPVFTMQKSLGDVLSEIYFKYPNEAMVGIYELMDPVLVLRDLGLIEKVLIQDFGYFTDHPKFGNDDGVFGTTLFNLKGSVWRALRYKITPSFTVGKFKRIFPQMVKCSEQLLTIINKSESKNVKNIIAEVVLDVIATCIFGIEIKNLKARQEFIDMSNNLFYGSMWRYFKQNFFNAFPKTAESLGIRFFPLEVDTYFRNIVLATIKQRETSAFEQDDYLQYLIELKKKGKITVHAHDKHQDDNYLKSEDTPIESIEITDTILIGQALQFLITGFDPLLNATTYVFYELSLNLHIQDEVRKEINEKLKKHGTYSYEALKDMTYLEQCIYESLRIHPLASFHMRVCTKTYTTPDGVVIEKGTKVNVPAFAIHMDPQYFDEPTKFNPDRFATTSKPTGYTPFGDGPRICIGMRFALVEVKLLVARITENFTYALNPKTDNPIKYKKSTFPVLESEVVIDFKTINK